MKETLYKKYENASAIGVYPNSNWGGVEVLDIIDGGEFVITALNYGVRYMVRRNRVYTSFSGRMYFRKQDRRYYLDEVLKNA